MICTVTGGEISILQGVSEDVFNGFKFEMNITG
jgi:hypothetical protein